MSRICSALAVLITGPLLWSSATAQGAPNAAIEWNKTLLTIVRTAGAQPATIHSTRSFAILHAAMYDAVSSIDGHNAPYLVHIKRVPEDASQEAAAHSAAHDVLVSLYPSFQTTLDAELQQDLAEIPDGPRKATGMSVGQAVAQAILKLREGDGSAAPQPKLDLPVKPGRYQLTPPNLPSPAFTQWPGVTPFGLRSAKQFRPGPPPALNSAEYTAVFIEVKSLGMNGSTTATADQQLIGKFWGGQIQNYWNEIAQSAAEARHLSLASTARLFALLNISLADSAIAMYDAKYTYLFWRPVTAIQEADIDGNPNTIANPTWLPQPLRTAGDPSYPGAHATISKAAAFVLDFFFGRQPIPLVVTSEALPGVVRTFNSFDAAEKEASLSRIYAGQHFRSDEDVGEVLGHAVADFDVDHLLHRTHEEGEEHEHHGDEY
ncbi:MAG TPA: phosphatase PAP2 family protein, partial [Steroidobacteraceae bacterium]